MHLLTDGKYSGRRKNRTGEGSQTLIFEETQDNLEMHHQLNGYEFEQPPGDGGRQRSLVCYIQGSQRGRHDLVNQQQQQPV